MTIDKNLAIRETFPFKDKINDLKKNILKRMKTAN